ncbi:MAG: protein YebE [Rhodobacteraceae bacterium]|nr:MAG: protein YebE [Paracoccaceae bacterium]
MSLMGTLAKVAIGMAVAKGVKSMTSGSASSGGGLGDLLGQLTGGGSSRSGGGGLGDILGQLGGAQQQSGGGLGDLLGQLMGGSAKSARSGTSGLEDLMGGVFNKAPQSGGGIGGLGGLLDSLAGSKADAGTGAGGLGDMLNQSFERFGEPKATPSVQQDATAGVMLKAMLQAAKSDGRIDAAEKEALFKNLGDVGADEMAFVNSVLEAPVDPQALAREVPKGSEAQTYMMSLMACDLDSDAEADYLNSFAVALGLEEAQVNQIHAEMNEPPLYG